MLNIDLNSPAVQQALGMGVATGKAREIVQLAGDAETGLASTVHLNTGKVEVVVVYGHGPGQQFLTLDVYEVSGEPLKIHLVCPRCHKLGTIQGDRKAIDFDPRALNPMHREIYAARKDHPELATLPSYLGRLSVETFECSWEVGHDRHVAGALHTGVSLCRMRLAIDNNRAKDA